MHIKGKKILLIGGAGLIGSHVVEELLKEDIKEVVIYYNFCRGTYQNLEAALKDPRCRMVEIGGNTCSNRNTNGTGLEGVGLRYMNVYGPRQDYKGTYIAVIMKILENIDESIPHVVYGDGSQSYDFITVEDTARANVCALKNEVPSRFCSVGLDIYCHSQK